jgi:hypothetical protein
MARVRTRLPNVFVGHPFAGRFPVKKFRRIFRELPFNVIYGNTDLQTRHLLQIMKSNIGRADYSIFDLSNWNPNVALELGLAEGLRRRPGKDYYILLNTRRSSEVPSDIRGIQRLEYTSYDFKAGAGIGDQLVNFILSKEYWIKRVWKEIPDGPKVARKRLMTLRILAHFRDHERLTAENLRSVARGTHLREDDRAEVLRALSKHKLVRKAPRGNVYTRYRRVYR